MSAPQQGPAGAAARPRPSRRRALLAVIGGMMFVHSTGAGLRMAIPLMALREMGLLGISGAMSAGLLMASFAFLAIVASMPAGRWVDRRGYHTPLRVAVALAVLGALVAVPAGLMAPAGSPLPPGETVSFAWNALRALLLVLSMCLVGASMNLGTICMQRTAARLAMQADDEAAADAPITPERAAAQTAELKRVFSWLGVAPSFSNVVGPMIAGVCIDWMGFGVCFAVMALPPLVALMTARLVPVERPRGPVQQVRRAHGIAAVKELLGLRDMKTLLLITWLVVGTWDMFMFLVPLQGHDLQLSASAIGTVLGVFSAAVAGVRLFLPAVAEHVEERKVLAGALAMMGIGFVVFPFAGSAVVMALLSIVVGMGMGVCQPMVLSALYMITPADRQGEAMGLRTACIALSGSVLPLFFGAMGAALGAALMFRTMAVVLLAGVRMPLSMRLEAK